MADVTSGYTVEVERCLRCGACAILAPAVFAVDRRVEIRRQPVDDVERAACRTAALVCPAQAITAVAS